MSDPGRCDHKPIRKLVVGIATIEGIRPPNSTRIQTSVALQIFSISIVNANQSRVAHPNNSRDYGDSRVRPTDSKRIIDMKGDSAE